MTPAFVDLDIFSRSWLRFINFFGEKFIPVKFILAYHFAGILFFLLCALSTIAHAYTITFGWDPNNESDLAGYILYVNDTGLGPPYRQLHTFPLNEIDPNNPAYTVTELKENAYYCFVLTAYNTAGFESGFSNVVCVLGGQDVTSVLSHGEGGGGGGCFVSIAKDN